MAFVRPALRPMALAITLALLHLNAIAQSAVTTLPEIEISGSREAANTYNPPTTTTATRMEAPLRDIPQTVNVVPQKMLRDQAVRSMEDVLKSVPGVGLSHGDGQRDQVTIRGFTAIGDQFIDGLRDDALYFRDLSNIEQVEVLKGPAAVLYGRGSSGGLINRITKKPGINLTEVTGQIGSFEQRRGEFDLARTLSDGNVAFRITGAVERADSYRDKQFLNREAFAPSVLFKLGTATDLLIQAEYLSDRRITDFGIPAFQGRPVDVPRSTYFGAANARDVDTSESRVKAAGFTLNHRFSDTLSLRNGFRYYEYDLNRNNTLVSGVNEANLTASLLHGNVLREEDGYFNQTELSQKAVFGGIAHQILYGLELGKQDKDQFVTRQPVGTVALFNPVLSTVPLIANNRVLDSLGTLETSSLYVQDLITLSPQWKALAGVRFDRFKQETEERIAGRPSLSRTDTEWSPRVGMVYQPSLTQSYYASVSRSFQPSAELQPLTAAFADFAPEKTTNKEIGAKLDFFGGQASATAAVFELERTNVKETDPVTRAVVQIGEQRTRGLELMFTGELPRGWQIWSGYAYLDAEITSSPVPALRRKRATLTPKHSANLWLVKSLGSGWRAGAGVNYVDDRAADPANRVTLPGYTTVEAMAGYKMGKLDLQFNVYNLFDREYIVSGHGVSPNLNLPGAPRTAQLTARYRF
jgi:catecholate siderophore receptor